MCKWIKVKLSQRDRKKLKERRHKKILGWVIYVVIDVDLIKTFLFKSL